MSGERQVRCMALAVEALGILLRGECWPVLWTNAPKDLEVVAVHQDVYDRMSCGRVCLVVRSQEFEPIERGQPIPGIAFSYSNSPQCPEGMRQVNVMGAQ